MIPLLFTRQFVLQRQLGKRENQAESMIYTDASNSVYTVHRVDTAAKPERRSQLYFEIECRNTCQEQKLFVGLLVTTALGSRTNSPGLGISIDPETGLIMDLVNQQGVIGYLEAAPLAPNQTFQIGVEIDIIRNVYLPRLHIGNETFLHPALYMESAGQLSALVGTAVVPNGRARFENPRLEMHAVETVAA